MIDQTYVNNLVSAINGIPDCKTLMTFLEKEAADLIKQMESALTSFANQQNLSTPPTDLVSVIKWITAQIKMIETTMQNTLQTYIQTVAAYTKIMAAVEKKAAELNCLTQLSGITGLKIPGLTLPGGLNPSQLNLTQIQGLKLPTIPTLPKLPPL